MTDRSPQYFQRHTMASGTVPNTLFTDVGSGHIQLYNTCQYVLAFWFRGRMYGIPHFKLPDARWWWVLVQWLCVTWLATAVFLIAQ